MEPTYLHQTYLPIPFPVAKFPHTRQPFTDAAICRWITANKLDASRRDVLVPGYLGLIDVPSDQVLCMVILAISEASCLYFCAHGCIAKLTSSLDNRRDISRYCQNVLAIHCSRRPENIQNRQEISSKPTCGSRNI